MAQKEMVDIDLPRDFSGMKMPLFAADFSSRCDGKIPKIVCINFATLGFIRATGVVFLSNFVEWLQEKGCEVRFSGTSKQSDAIIYLDDSKFFKRYLGEYLREEARVRGTTMPLKRIANAEVHAWLELKLIPWLASHLAVTKSSLHDFKTVISELFNNIQDHTRYDIGNIFVQYHPKEKKIIIAIADWGAGIPVTVKEKAGEMSDGDAILLAVSEGFSAKSRPSNRGAGLPLLLDKAVKGNGGEVTIFSRNGIVTFANRDGSVVSRKCEGHGYSPGTAIEICLRTDTIELIPDEMEDLEWE